MLKVLLFGILFDVSGRLGWRRGKKFSDLFFDLFLGHAEVVESVVGDDRVRRQLLFALFVGVEAAGLGRGVVVLAQLLHEDRN